MPKFVSAKINLPKLIPKLFLLIIKNGSSQVRQKIDVVFATWEKLHLRKYFSTLT